VDPRKKRGINCLFLRYLCIKNSIFKKIIEINSKKLDCLRFKIIFAKI